MINHVAVIILTEVSHEVYLSYEDLVIILGSVIEVWAHTYYTCLFCSENASLSWESKVVYGKRGLFMFDAFHNISNRGNRLQRKHNNLF